MVVKRSIKITDMKASRSEVRPCKRELLSLSFFLGKYLLCEPGQVPTGEQRRTLVTGLAQLWEQPVEDFNLELSLPSPWLVSHLSLADLVKRFGVAPGGPSSRVLRFCPAAGSTS